VTKTRVFSKKAEEGTIFTVTMSEKGVKKVEEGESAVALRRRRGV